MTMFGLRSHEELGRSGRESPADSGIMLEALRGGAVTWPVNVDVPTTQCCGSGSKQSMKAGVHLMTSAPGHGSIHWESITERRTGALFNT